jgi:hypothetical protein
MIPSYEKCIDDSATHQKYYHSSPSSDNMLVVSPDKLSTPTSSAVESELLIAAPLDNLKDESNQNDGILINADIYGYDDASPDIATSSNTIYISHFPRGERRRYRSQR